MPTTIKIKNGSGAPAASDLVQGEPAFDLTNKRLYTENGSGTVIEVGTSPSTIDINAGTIDGAVIGGATPAAGTFTTITGSGDLAVDTDTLFVDVSADKVGIGTTTPAEDLNIVGASGAAKLRFDGDSSNLQNNFIGITGYDDLIIASDEANSGSASTIQFRVDASERMRITSAGAVGIGDTAPAAKLEVNGNVIAKTDTDTSNTGSVTLDFGANQNFVLTLTGNVTLANPSTEVVGQSGFIVFIQDGTGGRTVSLGSQYKTASGAGLTLSSAASTTDIVPYVVSAADSILLGAPQLAFSN